MNDCSSSTSNIARLGTALPARTALLVLGMHRSGTSALTRVLSLLGATLPKNLLGAGPGNETGHWEPGRLIGLHDRMLAEAGSSWDDWRKLDLAASLEPARLGQYKADIRRVLEEEFGNAQLIALKEPRICRFAPLYIELLAEQGYDCLSVLPLRNPLAVIASLEKRNGMTEGFAALLWLRHVLDAEAATRGRPRVLISYEALLAGWRPSVEQMTSALRIEWPNIPTHVAPEISSFLRSELQHHIPDPHERACVPDWVINTYSALRVLETTPDNASALTSLDDIAQDFNTSAPIFGAATFPEIATREAKFRAACHHLPRTPQAHEQPFGQNENAIAVADPGDCSAEINSAYSTVGAQTKRELPAEKGSSTFGDGVPGSSPTTKLEDTEGSQSQAHRSIIPLDCDQMYAGRRRPPPSRTNIGLDRDTLRGGVSIVIPYHNQTHWLLLCLDALAQSAASGEIDIIVVNDNSNPEELSFLAHRVQNSQIRVVNNGGERGFGGSCNYGWRAAREDLILFLNTDCLIAPNTIEAMSRCFGDERVGLVSALTNNAEETRFPMFPGLSYVDMANLLSDASSDAEKMVDVRTAEGHCLMASRRLLEETGGFSPEWGLGYGEETDLHFRSTGAGYRSVVALTTYVYHQGKQSFGEDKKWSALRRKNYEKFMNRWGNAYKKAHHLSHSGPTQAEKNLERNYRTLRSTGYDVLFILPGYTQGVGGIQSVVDFVNELILRGYRANCVLLADSDLPRDEPMLFMPLQANDVATIAQLVRATVVCSTHHSTIPFAEALSSLLGAEHINYAQGVETYFSKGTEAFEAAKNLKTARNIIANSSWTASLISPYANEAQIRIGFPHIPVGLFLDRKRERWIDVLAVLRAAPDKGQGKIMDMLSRLAASNPGLSVAVLAAPEYFRCLRDSFAATPVQGGHGADGLCSGRLGSLDLHLKLLPLSRSQIASIMDQAKVFVDCSDHEGFGLLSAEAALAGVHTICTDSGGFTTDFAYCCDVLPADCNVSLSLVQAISRALDHQWAPRRLGKLRYPHNSFVDLLTEHYLSSEENPTFRPIFNSEQDRGNTQKANAALRPKPTWKYRTARKLWTNMPHPLRSQAIRLSAIVNRLINDEAAR